ncbi:MAG: DUF3667 domain-containing protein [Flavobacteriaceae bacterium]
MPTEYQCKNCEKSFDASFDYCPYCGQETADNLTFKVLFSNTISNYFDIDARVFKSFLPLLFKPGILARRFVDGKRLKYLHPAQFYLFISVVFFFIFSFNVREADTEVTNALKKGFNTDFKIDSTEIKTDSIAIAKTKKSIKENLSATGISSKDMQAVDSVLALETQGPNLSVGFNDKRDRLDSLIASNAPQTEKLEAMGLEPDAGVFTKRFYSQMLKLYERKGDGILNALYNTIPIAMFFMLPLFAFLLKIFYWKRATFAHHMVFSFYFFTFLFTVFSILILANKVFPLPVWFEVLLFLSFVVYLMVALRNFYRSSWFGAFLKANFISFLFLSFVVPIAVFGIAMVSFMVY